MRPSIGGALSAVCREDPDTPCSSWHSNWRWHLDEVFVRINGKTHYHGVPLTMKAKSLRFFDETAGPQGCA